MSRAYLRARRVRVWFGEDVVADYRADAALADRYVVAMTRRFIGLRITNDPVPDPDLLPARPLPGERLWGLTPR